MMKKALSLVLLLVLAAPAYCWNDTGHMIAARITWLKLNQPQKDKVTQILLKHPHYDEFLKADRPDGLTEPEWVFLRAATWSDWVRSHHQQEYSHPTWHYVNYPFILPDSGIDPTSHQPPADEVNIVSQLGVAVKQIKNAGSQADQAVYLCWLLHLGGDLHQPLHATALFSKKFPDGDRGGNLAYVVLRTGEKKIQLHPIWDGLLGKGRSAGDINGVVADVKALLEAEPNLIKADLENHTTFESWAKESFEMAKSAAYLNGKLPLGDSKDDGADIGVVPEDYLKNAGRVARIQIAKAGARLATTIGSCLE